MSFLLRNAPQVLLSAQEIIKSFKDLVNRSFQVNELDLTYDQWMVINAISKKQGVTQIYIADTTHKEPASISRILKLLEKKNFIQKINEKGNLRAKQIYLTPRGDDVHRRATRLFNMIAKDGFVGIHDQEINLFVRILDKLQSNFITPDHDPI